MCPVIVKAAGASSSNSSGSVACRISTTNRIRQHEISVASTRASRGGLQAFQWSYPSSISYGTNPFERGRICALTSGVSWSASQGTEGSPNQPCFIRHPRDRNEPSLSTSRRRSLLVEVLGSASIARLLDRLSTWLNSERIRNGTKLLWCITYLCTTLFLLKAPTLFSSTLTARRLSLALNASLSNFFIPRWTGGGISFRDR